MALLNRLFSSRKKPQLQRGYVLPNPSGFISQYSFNKDQVRILLFRECERRGRKLLFDSKAVKRVSLSNSEQCKVPTNLRKEEFLFVEMTNGFGYQYFRPGPDIKTIGEMIFGSVAIILRGPNIKIHVGDNPPAFMMTKVTYSPTGKTNDQSMEDSYGSSISSMNEYFSSLSSSDSKVSKNSASYPLDVPYQNHHHRFSETSLSNGLFFNIVDADSGCYASSAASSDSRKSSGGSLSSLRRRWLRTACTTLDMESAPSLIQSDSSLSCTSLPIEDRNSKRSKLGVAVIISLPEDKKESMKKFLLEHGVIVESIITRLHAAVEKAYCCKEHFVSMMYEATCDIQTSIENLFLAPRIAMPVWLGMISSQSSPYYHSISAVFIQDLCQLLDIYDKKENNFFVSTLITAVLTNHLGWVPTVAPGVYASKQNASTLTMSTLFKCHPYNPLWAQVMDLYGALGNPLRSSRTIITSTSPSKSHFDLIDKILNVLTYFIRCAAIEHKEPQLVDSNIHNCLQQQEEALSSPPTLSGASSTTLQAPSGNSSPCIPGNTSQVSSLSVAECASSKSENFLNITTNQKSAAGNALRRTMSYTSKMSKFLRSGNFSSNNDDSNMSSDSESQQNGVKCGQNSDHASTISKVDTLSEKVTFVLGEDEDLSGLKTNFRSKMNIETESCAIEKATNEPLSFCSSEVESGFSECESSELSPVRSDCDQKINAMASDDDQTLYKSNLKGHTLNALQTTLRCHLPCSRIFTPDSLSTDLNSKLISKTNMKETLLKTYNFRSLSRSLSVNLPVYFKSKKTRDCYSEGCLKCGKLTSNSDSPLKQGRNRIFTSLCRSHSSFCIPKRNKVYVKSILCHNCLASKTPEYEVVKQASAKDNVSIHKNFSCNRKAFGKVIDLPVPSSNIVNEKSPGCVSLGISQSLFGRITSGYISERVLQGCAPIQPGWEVKLKRDLLLDAHRPILDHGLCEAVAVVASIDNWEVQLMSSHTYVVDRPGLGVKVHLSQLVANMLESLLHMWKLRASPELCLAHLEARLRELWTRSQALAELLLTTDFCDMDLLTYSLSLEENDVPLLLAVASTHSPQVTQRYGVTFH